MSALRAPWPVWLTALVVVGGLAGCTNPDYAYNVDEGACPGQDTTAPVPGEDCPIDEEGTGSASRPEATPTADADLGGN